MRGRAWRYATRLLAPRSFYAAAGCDGSGQPSGVRSGGQVRISAATWGGSSARSRTAATSSLRGSFRPGRLDGTPIIRLSCRCPPSAPGDLGVPGNPAPGVLTPDPPTLPPVLPPAPISPSPTPDPQQASPLLPLSLEGAGFCPGSRTPSGFPRSPRSPYNPWPPAGRDVSPIRAGTSRSRC